MSHAQRFAAPAPDWQCCVSEAAPARVAAAGASAKAAGRRVGLPAISCVVPWRNEAANLRGGLLPMLRGVLDRLTRHSETVLVDDGSIDETAALLAAWTSRFGVRVLQPPRNFGKHATSSADLQAARGDVMVVLMAADFQHPLPLIEALVADWQRGADVVHSARESRRCETASKHVGIGWFHRFIDASRRFEVPRDAEVLGCSTAPPSTRCPSALLHRRHVSVELLRHDRGVPYQPPRAR